METVNLNRDLSPTDEQIATKTSDYPVSKGGYKSTFTPGVSNRLVYVHPQTGRTYTITPAMIPAYSSPGATQDLLSLFTPREEPSATRGKMQYGPTSKPYWSVSPKEAMIRQAGDASYPVKILKHMRSTWNLVNSGKASLAPARSKPWEIQFRDPDKNIGWFNQKNPVAVADDTNISPSASAVQFFDHPQGSKLAALGKGSPKFTKQQAEAMTRAMNAGTTSLSFARRHNAPSWPYLRNAMWYHELLHQAQMAKNAPMGVWFPASPLINYTDDKYGDEEYSRLVDLYSLSPVEVAQAQASYNRNKYALKRAIAANPSIYLKGGFNQQELDRLSNMPDFYAATPIGRQQFKADMQFFRENPAAMELLGSEGSRHVVNILSLQNAINALKMQQAAENSSYLRFLNPIESIRRSVDLSTKLKNLQEIYENTLNFRVFGNNRRSVPGVRGIPGRSASRVG